MVYKVGSKGDEVKAIQKVVGVTPDGDFGPKTETAVKQWQKDNKLESDGIVGPLTLAKMFPGQKQSNSKCIHEDVTYMPLSVHVSKSPNRPIKYLAIHYTAGGSSKDGSAKSIKGIFEKRQASADFAVDDTTMAQFNPDLRNYYCWAVGDKKNPYGKGGQLYGIATNKNTISIEVCSTLQKGTSSHAANHSGWSYTDSALDNAVKLAKIIMEKYNIDIDHVVRHYDISGKLCPGIPGYNNGPLYDPITGKSNGKTNNSDKWKQFKDRLR